MMDLRHFVIEQELKGEYTYQVRHFADSDFLYKAVHPLEGVVEIVGEGIYGNVIITLNKLQKKNISEPILNKRFPVTKLGEVRKITLDDFVKLVDSLPDKVEG